MRPPLHVVSSAPKAGETVAQRAARLMAEAHEAGDALTVELLQSLRSFQALVQDVAQAGEAVHVGIRDAARKLAADLEARIQTIEAIRGRQ